jgi:hypothetical protein
MPVSDLQTEKTQPNEYSRAAKRSTESRFANTATDGEFIELGCSVQIDLDIPKKSFVRGTSSEPVGPKKLAIIGGCHVAGYLVKGNSGFADLIHHKEYQIDKFSYINAGSKAKIQNIFQQKHYEKVIFQLGNYESPPARSKAKAKAKASSIQSAPQPVKHSPIKQRFKYIAKRIIYAFCLIFGKDISMRSSFPNDYLSRIEDAKRAGCKEILLLSPFPSCDPWTQFCRKRAAKLIHSIAKANNVEYMDIWSAVSDEMYADDFHFNELGHERVAQKINAHLLALTE